MVEKTEPECRCAAKDCGALPLLAYHSIHDDCYTVTLHGYLCVTHTEILRDKGPLALIWREENSDDVTCKE